MYLSSVLKSQLEIKSFPQENERGIPTVRTTTHNEAFADWLGLRSWTRQERFIPAEFAALRGANDRSNAL